MASTFTKFNCFSEDLVEGVHDFAGDTFKFYLTNTAPDVANDAVKADLAEITPEHGYSSGGHTTTITTSRTGAITTIFASDVTITAAGGTFGPARYAVLYNDTATGDPLIGYYDMGAAVTFDSGTGDTLGIDNNGSTGIIQVA